MEKIEYTEEQLIKRFGQVPLCPFHKSPMDAFCDDKDMPAMENCELHRTKGQDGIIWTCPKCKFKKKYTSEKFYTREKAIKEATEDAMIEIEEFKQGFCPHKYKYLKYKNQEYIINDILKKRFSF